MSIQSGSSDLVRNLGLELSSTVAAMAPADPSDVLAFDEESKFNEYGGGGERRAMCWWSIVLGASEQLSARLPTL